MNTVKMLAIVLTVSSGLGLAYGSFTYTSHAKETPDVTAGPEAGFAVISYTHDRRRAPAEAYSF